MYKDVYTQNLSPPLLFSWNCTVYPSFTATAILLKKGNSWVHASLFRATQTKLIGLASLSG